MNKWTVISVVFILLLAGNVYQYWNPKIIEVPSGQQEIDPGAWVQRSAYVTRGALLDSLRKENEELANRVKDSRDRIANLTLINGKLDLKADSLRQELETQPIDLDFLVEQPFEPQTLYFPKTFGNNLFQVVSGVTVYRDSLKNEIELKQLRDIRVSVTNTMTDDRSRMLTYVTSPDFVSLEYQTYTELSYKTRRPMFLYGLAGGFLISAILIK